MALPDYHPHVLPDYRSSMQSMYSSFNRPAVAPVAPVVLRIVLGGLFV